MSRGKMLRAGLFVVDCLVVYEHGRTVTPHPTARLAPSDYGRLAPPQHAGRPALGVEASCTDERAKGGRGMRSPKPDHRRPPTNGNIGETGLLVQIVMSAYEVEHWLPRLDSNQHCLSQSQVAYRWPTGEWCARQESNLRPAG